MRMCNASHHHITSLRTMSLLPPVLGGCRYGMYTYSHDMYTYSISVWSTSFCLWCNGRTCGLSDFSYVARSHAWLTVPGDIMSLSLRSNWVREQLFSMWRWQGTDVELEHDCNSVTPSLSPWCAILWHPISKGSIMCYPTGPHTGELHSTHT